MAKQPKDIAASVRQRLLNLAREEQQVFEVVLVAFGLERLIYRLSVSNYRERFVLKGGMKDFYDLWAVPNAREIPDDELARALKSTFDRRQTEIPTDRPPGLSEEFATEPTKVTQWTAYAESTELEDVSLEGVVEEIWEWLAPICLAASKLSFLDIFFSIMR